MSIERAGSQRLFDRARRVIPGGVNSPVRAFRGVGGTPVFFKEGRGAWLTDVDGHRYVDHVGSWGPLILGYTHPEVMDAIREALAAGTTFGAPTELEVRFAEAVCAAVDSDIRSTKLNGTVLHGGPCRVAINAPRILGFVLCHYVKVVCPVQSSEQR